MELEQAIEILENHQKWLNGYSTTPPKDTEELSGAIDLALQALRMSILWEKESLKNLKNLLTSQSVLIKDREIEI